MQKDLAPNIGNISKEKRSVTECILGSQVTTDLCQLPEIFPIKTLTHLMRWMPGYDEFSIGQIVRRPVKRDKSKPKTLLCHDMKGGYIEDKFVQGYNSAECYRLHQWYVIDIFCYFSHNLVTIPPPCWTNAAHSHGVKVLGTFITEWNEGAAVCADIFQDISQVRRVAQILVEIAVYYQFDGWLINIENPININLIDNLRQFLIILSNSIHEKIPGSEIIWYDSVTKTGELKWQNKLCNDNRIFFDACDGIFLNYNWSILDLQHSLYTSGAERQHDIYVGVDVFGRGCYGGGGWNTCKALDVIRNKNMSCAIFAPGWVMETLEVEKFAENDKRFWSLLASYLYVHCMANLPLVSTFCQGYGQKIFMCGREVVSKAWTNLSAISVQPTFSDELYQLGPVEGMMIKSAQYDTALGFNGGGSFTIEGCITPQKEQTRTLFRLFSTSISLKSSEDYFLSYAFHSSCDDVQLFFLLYFKCRPNYVVFSPNNVASTSLSSTTYTIPLTQEGNYINIYPAEDDSSSLYGGFVIHSDWNVRNYRFSLKENNDLKEVRLGCTTGGFKDGNKSKDFVVRIGEIRIQTLADLNKQLPSATKLQCRGVNIEEVGDSKRLSFTLSWDVVVEKDQTFPKCFDIFCSGGDEYQELVDNSATHSIKVTSEESAVYIGRAFVNSYLITQLVVPFQCTNGIALTVQSISYAEIRQNFEACGRITLKWFA